MQLGLLALAAPVVAVKQALVLSGAQAKALQAPAAQALTAAASAVTGLLLWLVADLSQAEGLLLQGLHHPKRVQLKRH